MPRSPKESALAAGLGTILGAGVAADAAIASVAGDHPPARESAGAKRSVLVRVEDGKYFVSEFGGLFEEVDVGDGPAAQALRDGVQRIMPKGGVVALPVGPDIIARGGASGGWSFDPLGRKAKKSTHPHGGAAPEAGPRVPESN